MRLNTLINRVEKAGREVERYVREACEQQVAQRWIVDANRGQLAEGKNARGEMMNGGVYSPHYMFFRMRRGLPVRHVYLNLDGGLQEGMMVEYSETGFSVKSTDWKQQFVDYTMETGHWPPGNQPEYGPVFGLTEENKGLLARMIAPVVAGKIRRRILQ